MEPQVLKEAQVGSMINGTNLKGYLTGYTFTQLIEALGRPTYHTPSADEKVQVEWVMRFKKDGRYIVATLYDWKTYDHAYTTMELTEWNIGGHG